jgi:hypothetical protein
MAQCTFVINHRNMYIANTIIETPSFTLPQAIRLCEHYQYLVDNYYDLANPGLGKVQALIIHSFGKGEEWVKEYKQNPLPNINGKIFRTKNHRREEYDVMLVAQLNHPQLKTGFDIFKDLRTYVIEQSIDFPIPSLLQ